MPNLDVLVVRVASEMDKDALISMDPSLFFTEPHYDGYAAILVRLAAVDDAMLKKLLADSWRLRAPSGCSAESEAGAARIVGPCPTTPSCSVAGRGGSGERAAESRSCRGGGSPTRSRRWSS